VERRNTWIANIEGSTPFIPVTVPSVFCHACMQAHHLDLSFYDEYLEPGACLETHRDHHKVWH